jgi:hypothetical protein
MSDATVRDLGAKRLVLVGGVVGGASVAARLLSRRGDAVRNLTGSYRTWSMARTR